MAYAEFTRTESINKHGHLQTYDEDGEKVCAQCGCCYENRGEGTMCGSCRAEFMTECELDYADGLMC